jgi:hypothetical protein
MEQLSIMQQQSTTAWLTPTRTVEERLAVLQSQPWRNSHWRTFTTIIRMQWPGQC